MREVIILGSTGSIGTQALEVIAAHPDRFAVVGLAAGGTNAALLASQALDFQVKVVAVARARAAQDLQLAFYAEAARRGYEHGEFTVPKILAGPDAPTELAGMPCDVVLNGITGSIGLSPTLAALRAGSTLALANKESLVAGGPLVRAVAKPGQIVPVDSEHSALAQALRSGTHGEVRRLILTASGGAFRGRTMAELENVTAEQALAHPNWDMGPVVTVNTATLVNKGLELIEAHELFDIAYEDIVVTVHPQSIVHSLVEFYDGSTIAQASQPDMRLPIALGLDWPTRIPNAADSALPWDDQQSWTFAPLDNVTFPAVEVARAAGKAGGLIPAIFNAANEECVAGFLAGTLRFPHIIAIVQQVLSAGMGSTRWKQVPGSVADVLSAEKWAREKAHELMEEAH
ncbi:MAG: 1-deoxy-D-xylulose-5-phosphate reductoisomerase [Corynebacteriales bacterium]|nr:1-deoxy-D-xylulose-5-phosphate reductoisomerase [Mycobacteriales bacterium]